MSGLPTGMHVRTSLYIRSNNCVPPRNEGPIFCHDDGRLTPGRARIPILGQMRPQRADFKLARNHERERWRA